ncbi:hypothetical protein Q5705_03100 [Kosakonia sp. H02]|nr:hypothetical protein Q5705_03100 [Kosakonia sp. H02]
MIEIVSGTRTLRISPFERENVPDAPPYDRITTFVEYQLPELKTQYQATFLVGELIDLKESLRGLHTSLINNNAHSGIVFDSTENQLNMHFLPVSSGSAVGLELILRPENPAESVVVTDYFGIDESYFPALVAGLDEMINWRN